MSWQRWSFAILVVLIATVYYALTAVALRDLVRRNAVRGENKTAWGLVIVCLPIAGALLYGYMGAAGFIPRPGFVARRQGTIFDDLLVTESDEQGNGHRD
jgi:hypothetical protein